MYSLKQVSLPSQRLYNKLMIITIQSLHFKSNGVDIAKAVGPREVAKQIVFRAD